MSITISDIALSLEQLTIISELSVLDVCSGPGYASVIKRERWPKMGYLKKTFLYNRSCIFLVPCILRYILH